MLNQVNAYLQAVGLRVEAKFDRNMAEVYEVPQEDTILFEETGVYLIKVKRGYIVVYESNSDNEVPDMQEEGPFIFTRALERALVLVVSYRVWTKTDRDAYTNDASLGCPECGSLEWNGTEACCLACSVRAAQDLGLR